MYKNQLQELAQRSCFNLPSYTCVREGPDHAPRFRSAVNFNGEVFDSPGFFTTLRQAEHAAAEVALNALSHRGPSHSLAARILDETGVYKNLLQEISQRVGAPLPSYMTVRSGLGHLPVFTCTVELAGITFTGEAAKSKKQAEKNAAMAAWSSLKQLAKEAASCSSEAESNNEEQEQMTIARALLNYRLKEKMNASPFPKKFPVQLPERSIQHALPTGSKILPLIRPRSRPAPLPSLPKRFPAAGAPPYVPVRHFGMAQPVTMRTAVPVFSAPPIRMPSPVRISPPPQLRTKDSPPIHVPPQRTKDSPPIHVPPQQPTVRTKDSLLTSLNPPATLTAVALPDPPVQTSEAEQSPTPEEKAAVEGNPQEFTVLEALKQLEL